MLWLLWKRPSWRGFYFYFGSRLKVRSSKVVLCLLPAFSSFSAPLFVPSVPFSRMWRAFQTLPARPCVRACVRTRRNVMAAFSGSRVLRSESPPPPLWLSEDSQSFFCCFWTKKVRNHFQSVCTCTRTHWAHYFCIPHSFTSPACARCSCPLLSLSSLGLFPAVVFHV